VGCAISVHSVAFSLLLAPVLQSLELPRRAAVGLALYALLIGVVYYPASAALTRIVHVLPVSQVHDGPRLRDGDVLLYTSVWTRPQAWRRGDIVVFRVNPASGHGAILRPGLAVDRIVGLPGDHVVCRHGVLLVNGQPPPPEHAPLRGGAGIPDLDIRAGRGEYIVLPTSLRWGEGPAVAAALRATLPHVARVPQSDLLGRAFWRARPFRRAGQL
jgi:signal peptidase I